MEPKATTSDKSNLLTTTQINSYFSRSGPKLAAKTACHENLEYMKEINKTIYTIYLQSITDIDYQIEIKNLKINSALITWVFSNNLLKIAAPAISSSLSDNFYKTLDNGVYPECLKIVKVFLYKKRGHLSNPKRSSVITDQ